MPDDKPATAETTRDKARGWQVAAQTLLGVGSTMPSEELTNNIVAAKTNQLNASLEINGPATFESLGKTFVTDCQPLSELQAQLIDFARQGVPSR